MARAWKCDICRLRKIKCDQSHPVCGQCRIKGRPCSYLGAKSEDDQALSLVATKAGEAGAFHTLALRGVGAKRRSQPKVEPANPLSNESSRLALRWIAMFGNDSTEASSFGIFGSLLSLVPARIGSHPALDFATAYVIQSHFSYKIAKDSNPVAPTKLRTQALASLRTSLTAPISAADSGGLLVSMALHIVAEYFRGSLGGNVPYLHVGAMCTLLKQRWTEGQLNELDTALIRAISGEEVLRAIHSGQPSQLEEVTEVCLSPLDHPNDFRNPRLVSDAILSQFCRLPRLISLVRDCVCEPDNAATAEAALANARKLYDFKIDPLPFNNTERTAKDVDYMREFNNDLLDTWIDFESVSDFVLTLRYYTTRALICGLIERLAQVGVATSNNFDLKEVQDEDIEAAESIAKCCRYALNPAWDPAWPALRFLLALRISYGTWKRAEQRHTLWQNSESKWRRAQAAAMKDFCLRISAHIGRLWLGWRMDPRIDEFGDTCVGGPMLTDLGRQVKQEDDQNTPEFKSS